ncbi:MAG: hypothetical protein WAM16_08410, partial [Nitrososphaeraceae archaeon]
RNIIKSGIYFNVIKNLRIIRQPSLIHHTGRIKRSLPRRVTPSRTTNIELQLMLDTVISNKVALF